MIEKQELLGFFQQQYRQVKGTRRDVRPGDRVGDDLDMDSLLVSEVLVALEDRYDLRLLHDPRVWKITTVGEMLDLVGTLEVEQRSATSAGSAA